MKKFKNFNNIFETNNKLNVSIENMIKGYIHTALWSNELNMKYNIDDFTKEEIDIIKKDMILFINKLKKIIYKYNLEKFIHIINKIDSNTLGGYIWLTRNHYGVSFLDIKDLDIEYTPNNNPYDKPYYLNKILYNIAINMQETELYFKKPDKDKKIKRFNL